MDATTLYIGKRGMAKLVCDGQMRECVMYDYENDECHVRWDTIKDGRQIGYSCKFTKMVYLPKLRQEALEYLSKVSNH